MRWLAVAILVASAATVNCICEDLSCASHEELRSQIQRLQDHVAETSSAAATNCTICFSQPCLNGGQCVPLGPFIYRCDCPDNFIGSNCQKEIKCTDKTCGKNAECFVRNHQTNCVCKPGYSGNPFRSCNYQSKKACMTGDPHYTTFDKMHYDYQGTCPYVFSAPCQNGSMTDGYSYYSVKAKNELWSGTHVSYVTEAEVQFYNMTIHVDNKLNVFVNNIWAHMPFYYPSIIGWQFRVTYGFGTATIENDQGVQVTFYPRNWLCVEVPDVPAFQGASTLCGLAGNIDKDCKDDLREANGNVIPVKSCYPKDDDAITSGDTWITTDFTTKYHPEKQCVPGNVVKNATHCDPQTVADKCQPIMDAAKGQGVFAACQPMGTDELTQIFNDCAYDLCYNPNAKCDIMRRFVRTCQQQVYGANLAGWRNDPSINCPITCPVHSSYQDCATACPATCASHDPADQCDKPCQEGCACDPGYVIDTTQPAMLTCVPIKQCGCLDSYGNMHPPDQPWLTNNCGTWNDCRNGTYYNKQNACSQHGHCDVIGGQMTCVCDPGFTGDGYTCTDINECLDPHSCNVDKHHGTCINTIGSYNCSCFEWFKGRDCEHYRPARHCADLYVYKGERTDGVYEIFPPTYATPTSAPTFDKAVQVHCDMTTAGGGWTRMGSASGNYNSNHTYAEYISGFGEASTKNQWLGLETIHALSVFQKTSLRLDLFRCAHNGQPSKTTDCTYKQFTVKGGETGYAVNIPSICTGTEVQYFDGWVTWSVDQDGPAFVAPDNDESKVHCSATFRNTGWWFDTSYRCGHANLNGVRYSCDAFPENEQQQTYLYWAGNPLGDVTMSLRPEGYPNYDPIPPQ